MAKKRQKCPKCRIIVSALQVTNARLVTKLLIKKIFITSLLFIKQI